MSPFDVLQFLERNGGRVTIRDGAPYVDFPNESNRKRLLDVILPHLKRHREFLLSYWRGAFPGLFAGKPTTREELIAYRRAKIVEFEKRALALGKRCLYLRRDGVAVEANDKPIKRKYKNPFPHKVIVELWEQATAIAVQGEQWFPLPKVTTREQDLAVDGPEKKTGERYFQNEKPKDMGGLYHADDHD